MSKITAIETQKNNPERCNLYVDGKFLAGVSMETVIKNHLKVGIELDSNDLGQIIFVSEKEKALSRALDYISKALKTKKQIKDYLIKKEYTEEVINYVLEKLIEYRLVDDVEYSKRYIESTSKKQGKKLIEYKLMSKGVRKQDIALAYDRVEVGSEDAVYTLALKHIRNKERTSENYAKTYRYLVGKGFLFEEIDRVISKLKESED